MLRDFELWNQGLHYLLQHHAKRDAVIIERDADQAIAQCEFYVFPRPRPHVAGLKRTYPGRLTHFPGLVWGYLVVTALQLLSNALHGWSAMDWG